MWVLKAAPRPSHRQSKGNGTIRDMITASSYVLSLSPKGYAQWVYSVGPIFVSVRTNKRLHHQLSPSFGRRKKNQREPIDTNRSLSQKFRESWVSALWCGHYSLTVAASSSNTHFPLSTKNGEKECGDVWKGPLARPCTILVSPWLSDSVLMYSKFTD